ncbi:MAG: hypothetical protein NVS1B2_16300 [Vulcanimicrobiaceae bacterium]
MGEETTDEFEHGDRDRDGERGAKRHARATTAVRVPGMRSCVMGVRVRHA